MKLPDLHIHTTHSDGIDSPAEVIRSAAYNKVPVVGFADHFEEVLVYSSFSRYLKEVSAAKKTSLCRVLTGIEVDVPDADAFLDEYCKNPLYDYVIFHEIKDVDEISTVGEVCKKIKIPVVLGHLDVANLAPSKELAQAVMDNKLVPEINQLHFSFLSKEEMETEVEFFSEFLKLNYPVSIGTDAMDSNAVGVYSESVKKLANGAKFFVQNEKTPEVCSLFLDNVVNNIGASNKVWSAVKEKTPLERINLKGDFLSVKEVVRSGSVQPLGDGRAAFESAATVLKASVSLPGEKKAALNVLGFLYNKFPSLRNNIIGAMEPAAEDRMKHVRKWALKEIFNVSVLDDANKARAIEIIEKGLLDSRPAVRKTAESLLQGIRRKGEQTNGAAPSLPRCSGLDL